MKYSYLFVARKSIHSKYYHELLRRHPELGEYYNIKKIGIPRKEFIKKAGQLTLEELTPGYFERKKIKIPFVFKSKLILGIWGKIKRWLEVYRVAALATAFKKSKHYGIVIVNGQKQPKLSAVLAAKIAEKKTAFFEGGLLPNSTTLDFRGVNCNNSLPRNGDFYLTKNLNNLSEPDKLLVVREAVQEKLQLEDDLPKNYIFIPFQVALDTQVVINSSWIRSMEKFYQVIESLLSRIDKNITFVIKEHPSCKQNYQHLHYKSDRIVFRNRLNTQKLIEKSQGVITLNSSVGMEALLLEKKVIVCADACYDIPDLVLNATNEKELLNAVNSLSDWRYNANLRTAFIKFVAHFYAIPEAYKVSASSEHFLAVKKRLQLGYIEGLDPINE